MTATLFSARYWLLANLAGFSLFVYFSSWLWVPRGQEGLLGGPGDNIIGGLTVLPVFLLFALANLIWLVLICVSSRPPAKWPQLLLWALVVACWGSGIWYDRSRSYTGKDVLENVSR